MRLAALCLLAFYLAMSSVAAQSELPVAVSADPPEIPIYGEAELVTELSISDEDILGYLRLAMLAFGSSARAATGEIGSFIQAIDPETLANAISDLKHVRMLQLQLAKPEEPRKILDYYAENIGPGWQRVLWDISQPNRGGMLLVRPGLTEVLAVGVMLEKPIEAEDDPDSPQVEQPKPPGQRVAVVRSVGMINLEKIGAWAGNAIVRFSEIESRKRIEREAAAED